MRRRCDRAQCHLRHPDCPHQRQPGIIATERFQEIAEKIPEVFEKLAAETPIGRFGDMAEIAATVDWLLRAAPAYMTGTVLPLDGGRTA